MKVKQLLFCLLLLVGTVTIAKAAPVTISGTSITWDWSDDNRTLTISGTGAMPDYMVALMRPWDSYALFVKKIVIEEGVTKIGTNSFYQFNSLTDVTVSWNNPGSISYGDFLFNGVTVSGVKLHVPTGTKAAYQAVATWSGFNIEEAGGGDPVPDGTKIDDSNTYWKLNGTTLTISGTGEMPDFANYTVEPWWDETIISVVIEEGVTRVGKKAFSDCEDIRSVSLPASLESIGEFAFNNCTSLSSITIPKKVTEIGKEAFKACESLTIVTFEAGSQLETIGMRAFYSCNISPSIDIPGSVRTIATNALAYNADLKDATVHWTDFTGLSVEADIFDADKISTGTLTIPAGKKSMYEAVDPWQIFKTIAEAGGSGGDPAPDGTPFTGNTNAFWKLDGGVLTISGTGAIPDFSNTTGQPWDADKASITSVVIGDGITGIGNYTFALCSNLTTIEIPAGVTTIGLQAFDGSGVNSVTFKNGSQLTTIGIGAFNACSALNNLNVPTTVTSIGDMAFASCTGMTALTVNWNSPITISPGVFANLATKNISLTIPAGTASAYAATNNWKYFNIAGQEFKTFFNESANSWNTWVFANITTETSKFREGYEWKLCQVAEASGNPSYLTLTHSGAEQGYARILVPNAGGSPSKLTLKFRSVGTGGAFDVIVSVDGGAPVTTSYSGFDNRGTQTKIITIPAGNKVEIKLLRTGATDSNNPDVQFFSVQLDKATTGSFTPFEETPNASWKIDETTGTLIISGTGDIQDFSSGLSNKPWFADRPDAQFEIKALIIGNGITHIGNYSFGDLANLNAVTFEATSTLQSIGENAFQSCAGLASITLPESLTSIGEGAFQNCGLTSIDIPANVTTIEDIAFYGCSSLANATVAWADLTGKTIAGDAFEDINSDAVLTVPAGKKSMYEAEIWTGYFKTIVEAGASGSDPTPDGTKTLLKLTGNSLTDEIVNAAWSTVNSVTANTAKGSIKTIKLSYSSSKGGTIISPAIDLSKYNVKELNLDFCSSGGGSRDLNIYISTDGGNMYSFAYTQSGGTNGTTVPVNFNLSEKITTGATSLVIKLEAANVIEVWNIEVLGSDKTGGDDPTPTDLYDSGIIGGNATFVAPSWITATNVTGQGTNDIFKNKTGLDVNKVVAPFSTALGVADGSTSAYALYIIKNNEVDNADAALNLDLSGFSNVTSVEVEFWGTGGKTITMTAGTASLTATSVNSYVLGKATLDVSNVSSPVTVKIVPKSKDGSASTGDTFINRIIIRGSNNGGGDTPDNKTDQTITWSVESLSATYGGTTPSLAATASSSLAVTYTSDNSAVASISEGVLTIVGIGTANIKANQAGNDSYNAAPDVSKVLTVSAKALTITGMTIANKVHDGNTTATISNWGTLNKVEGDDVSINQAGVTATFADAAVGDNKTVTVSILSLTGAKAANYTLTQPTGLTANITAANDGGNDPDDGGDDPDDTPDNGGDEGDDHQIGDSDTYWVVENEVATNDILIITGEGIIPDFSSPESQPWHSYRDQITSIVVNQNVVRIGDRVFSNLPNLTEVIFTSGELKSGIAELRASRTDLSLLESIGVEAFANCPNLKKIVFPGSLNTIGSKAFKGCTGLEKVYAPWEEPASLTYGANIFDRVDVKKVSLYVPDGTEAAYKAIDTWKDFYTRTFTGNDLIDSGQAIIRTEYYNLNGSRIIRQPSTGLYIQRDIKADGSVEVVKKMGIAY